MENVCVIDIYGVSSIRLLTLFKACYYFFLFLVVLTPLTIYGAYHRDCFSRVTVRKPTSILMSIRIYSVSLLSYSGLNVSQKGPTPKREERTLPALRYPPYLDSLSTNRSHRLSHSLPSCDPVNVKFLGKEHFVVSDDVSVHNLSLVKQNI
jgi:hypothetical protein